MKKTTQVTKLICILYILSAVLLLMSLIHPDYNAPNEPENHYGDESALSPIEARAREIAERTIGNGENDGIDNSWALWLINAKNPLPYGYLPELSELTVELEIDARVAEYALLMIMAARFDGVTLTPISAYRSAMRQESNFINFYNNKISDGILPEEAFEYTLYRIAVPYTSEHNAGIAIDFNLVEEQFDTTKEFHWLQENAHKFGFIMRYPKDSQNITGIIYEPWHYRFVGLYHAERIRNWGLTLEEYYGYCAADYSAVDNFRNKLLPINH